MTQTHAIGQEVEIDRIDHSLRKLWEVDHASTKASLINFAVYSESPGALEDNTQKIQKLTENHACRAILINSLPARPDGERSSKAWITAHCRWGGGDAGKSVCSEQISFLLEGHSSATIRNTVFAHLDSDLPLVLWWQGPLSERFDERLYSLVDRLIIDSSAWIAPQSQFAALETAYENSHARFIIHDLTWTRCFYFRQALAACCDSPAALDLLPLINRVRVTVDHGSRMAGLFLLTWIAQKLGWKKSAAEEDEFVSSFEGKPAHAIRWEINENDAGDALSELELESESGRIEISRQCQNRFLCNRVKRGNQEMQFVTPAGNDDEPDLINDQLSRGGNNRQYRNLLEGLEELL